MTLWKDRWLFFKIDHKHHSKFKEKFSLDQSQFHSNKHKHIHMYIALNSQRELAGPITDRQEGSRSLIYFVLILRYNVKIPNFNLEGVDYFQSEVSRKTESQ